MLLYFLHLFFPSSYDATQLDLERKIFAIHSLSSILFSFFVEAVEMGVLRALSRAFGEDPDAVETKPRMSPEEVERSLRELNKVWKRMRFKFL